MIKKVKKKRSKLFSNDKMCIRDRYSAVWYWWLSYWCSKWTAERKYSESKKDSGRTDGGIL